MSNGFALRGPVPQELITMQPMHVLVLGAGPTGLVTAMVLAKQGHRVTVVDQDPPPPVGGPDRVFADWKRPGVGQFSVAHILLPAGYGRLRHELPDVVDHVLERGGRPHNVIAGALRLMPRGVAEPDDARFATVAARRPVLEAALLAAAEHTEGVTVRRGTRARGLRTEVPSGAGVPHVTGLVLDEGEHLSADLVVAASGRSDLAALLPEAGRQPRRIERGWRYYTRHFRSSDGGAAPHMPWPLHHHNSVSIVVVPGDSDTWSVSLVTSDRDQGLRGLAREEAWHRAIALYPGPAPWAKGEQVGAAVAMGGVRSTRRQLVCAGRPLVTGLVALGDAWATTNPQFGLGMTAGILHAGLLRDVLRETDVRDPVELALRFEAGTERQLEPLRAGLARWDTYRWAEIDADIRGEVHRCDDEGWIQHVVGRTGGLQDAAVMRAMGEIGFLLVDPATAMSKPGLTARFTELAAGAPRCAEGPDRDELLAAVG